MPTAARVVAALIVGFIAFVVAGQARAQLPEGMDPGRMVQVSLIIGLICGWTILGRRADGGRMGFANAIGIGISAVGMTVFWVILLLAANEALRLSLARRFDGPMEAIYAMFPIMGEYGLYILNQESLSWLIGGSVVAGLAAHMAGKMWR